MKNTDTVKMVVNNIKVKIIRTLKVLAVIALLVAIFLIRIGIGTVINGGTIAPSDAHIVEVSSYDVICTLEEISELMTYSMDYSGVRKVEDSISVPKLGWKVPFSKHTICMTYCGTIKVGYDLSQVAVDVDNIGKKIHIELPMHKIVDNNLPEESVFTMDKNNVLNPIGSEEVVEWLAVIKQEEMEKAVEEGIYDLAEDNARKIIREALNTYDEYTVVFD